MKYFTLITVNRKDRIPKWNGCYYKIQNKTLKIGAHILKTNIKKESSNDISYRVFSAFIAQHYIYYIPALRLMFGTYSPRRQHQPFRGTMPVTSLKIKPNYINISSVCHCRSPEDRKPFELNKKINDTQVLCAVPKWTLTFCLSRPDFSLQEWKKSI